jgi:hypothetical protein
MELMSEPSNRSTHAHANKAEKRHPPKVDYYAELRTWVQRAIMEAEKSKDCKKKDELLSLLREL